MKKKRLVVGVGIGFLLVVWTLNAQAGQEERAQIQKTIQAALSERHPKQDREWWRALGPEAPEVIVSMWSITRIPHHRNRLIEALGWFPEMKPEILEELKATALTQSNATVRSAAIRAIGFSQGKREVEFVSQFLNDENVQIRLSAAKVLKGMSDAQADLRVSEHLKREKVSWFAKRLEGELPRPSETSAPGSSSGNSGTADVRRLVLAGQSEGWWISRSGKVEDRPRTVGILFQVNAKSKTGNGVEVSFQKVKVNCRYARIPNFEVVGSERLPVLNQDETLSLVCEKDLREVISMESLPKEGLQKTWELRASKDLDLSLLVLTPAARTPSGAKASSAQLVFWAKTL